MALVSDEDTDDSIHHGIFPNLSHCDILCFLSVAQHLGSKFLEYTPRYDEGVARSGGNALVELIYMDRNRPTLQFAFKRIGDTAGLDKRTKYRKLICELAVYEHALLRSHPNITNLTGITWSSVLGASKSPLIWPVLGFQLSQRGNLGTFLSGEDNHASSLGHRLGFCLDIGNGLQALHALNIMHGDLKPENVLIFEERGHLVAKLSDFDCSSFGQTDDSQVSIAGTPGWIAPELARRNARCCLRDARKADIYTYAKLCAWIIFGPVTDFRKFILNPGRTFDPVYETFDILAALQSLAHSSLDNGDAIHSREFILSEDPHTSLCEFFNSCFLGNPERREKSISKALAALEKTISELRVPRFSKDMDRPFSRNTSNTGLSLNSLRTSYIGSVCKRFLFKGKRGLPHRSISFRYYLVNYIFKPLQIILAGTFILAITVCAVLFLAYHKDIAQRNAPVSDGWAVAVQVGALLALIFLPFTLILSVLYFCKPSSYHRLVGQTKDDRFEDEEFFSSTNADELALVQRSEFVLLSNASGSHTLPQMSSLFPLLNRLHYRARLEVVDALVERQKCPACEVSAESMLSQLTAMAFGSLRRAPASEAGVIAADRAEPTFLRSFELWDANYEASLPDLPRGLISSLQDNRLDQYSVQELPEAVLTLFGEIEGKARMHPPLRCTQILYITLSRLCALVGRYEEAQICCTNAVCHVTPRNWRAPQDFSGRLAEATNNVERKWQHRRDVRRRQLQEREQNLFKFSMVDILEAQGKTDEAIDILRTVTNILNSPNGYYYEREPGHTLWHRETRTHDARNLLISLLIKKGHLEDVKRLDHHLDLDDALTNYEEWDNKVIDCFENATQMATALYDRSRYHEASQLQRERVRLSLAHFKGDRRRINQARKDLALSLSHSEDRQRLLEARKYQDWLVRHTDEGEPQISQLRLNRAYTLIQLGENAEGLKDIQAVITPSHEALGNQKCELLTTLLCSGPFLPTLESQEKIQTAFLRLCTIAPSEHATFKLVSSLCTGMTEVPIMHMGNDLRDILQSCLEHQTTSQSWPMRIAFCGPLLWCLCEYGWSNRNRDTLDEAVELASITLNEAVLTNPNVYNMNEIQKIVSAVYTKRALFLYRIQGHVEGDVDFLKETLQKLRNTSKLLSRDDASFGPFHRDLAALLTEQGAAFHDITCIRGAIEIYEDLLRTEGKSKTSKSGRLTNSYELRVELCHTQQILHAFQPGNAPGDSVKDTLQMLSQVREQLQSSREGSIWTQHLLADMFEKEGQIEIAQELHNTLFATMSKMRGKDHPETVSVEKALLQFRSRHSMHHYQYLAEFSRLRYTALRIFGQTHMSSFEYLSCYADALHSDPMAIDEAITLKREVVDKYKHTFGTSHTRFIDSASQLAWMLCRRGGCDHAEGLDLYEECLSSAAKILDPANPRTLRIWEAFLSQKLIDFEKVVDRLTERIAKALRDILPDDTCDWNLRDVRPVRLTAGLATDFVLSAQILGASHTFTTGQARHLKSIMVALDLPAQDQGIVRACLAELISNTMPDYLQPAVQELGLQWTVVREGLRALGDPDA